jgi:hypothetical protein
VLRFVLIAAGVAVVLIGVAAFVAWQLMRRAGRRVGGWQFRYLQLRVPLLPPGPRRDAARLRYRLHAELRATRDMLEAAPQGLIFRADAAGVLHELAGTAAALDRELAAISRFLDVAQQRTALQTITPQVRQLVEATYTARQTILRTAAEDRERQLEQLRANVAAQAAALDNYRSSRRELHL